MRSVWRSVVLAVLAAVLIAAVVLLVLFRYVLPQEEKRQQEQYEPRYVIGEWDGQVAVYEGGAVYPKQVYDVYIRALPAEAQEKILAGIPVEDADQLSVLLQDYTS